MPEHPEKKYNLDSGGIMQSHDMIDMAQLERKAFKIGVMMSGQAEFTSEHNPYNTLSEKLEASWDSGFHVGRGLINYLQKPKLRIGTTC